jgi:tRNA-uridine 2-sulfurtransferase
MKKMNTQTKTGKGKKTAAVALSGGVDSAYTAKILKDRGLDIFAVTMQITDDSSFDKTVKLVKKIAATLGIDSHIIDLRKEFEKIIIDSFCGMYLKGKTPNPCVECNKYIKFDLLLDSATKLGADFFATGHYVRIIKSQDTGEYEIRKGIDATKDQSYVLWKLSREKLEYILTPLGESRKEDIKRMAAETFPYLAETEESQDICFLGKKTYGDFLKERTGCKFPGSEGPVKDTRGKTLGLHKGYPFFTVGQRKGFGVSHTSPLYVIKIIPEENTIIVGEEDKLYCSSFEVKDVNYISKTIPEKRFDCRVRIRYNSGQHEAVFLPGPNGTGTVNFTVPQKAVTPGQSAVLYIEDRLAGGGIII